MPAPTKELKPTVSLASTTSSTKTTTTTTDSEKSVISQLQRQSLMKNKVNNANARAKEENLDRVIQMMTGKDDDDEGEKNSPNQRLPLKPERKEDHALPNHLHRAISPSQPQKKDNVSPFSAVKTDTPQISRAVSGHDATNVPSAHLTLPTSKCSTPAPTPVSNSQQHMQQLKSIGVSGSGSSSGVGHHLNLRPFEALALLNTKAVEFGAAAAVTADAGPSPTSTPLPTPPSSVIKSLVSHDNLVKNISTASSPLPNLVSLNRSLPQPQLLHPTITKPLSPSRARSLSDKIPRGMEPQYQLEPGEIPSEASTIALAPVASESTPTSNIPSSVGGLRMATSGVHLPPSSSSSSSSPHATSGLSGLKSGVGGSGVGGGGGLLDKRTHGLVNQSKKPGVSGIEAAALKLLQEQQRLQGRHAVSSSAATNSELSLRQTLSNISAAAAGSRAALTSRSLVTGSTEAHLHPSVAPANQRGPVKNLLHVGKTQMATSVSPSLSSLTSSTSLFVDTGHADKSRQQQQQPILPQGSPFTHIQQQPQFQRHQQILQQQVQQQMQVQQLKNHFSPPPPPPPPKMSPLLASGEAFGVHSVPLPANPPRLSQNSNNVKVNNNNNNHASGRNHGQNIPSSFDLPAALTSSVLSSSSSSTSSLSSQTSPGSHLLNQSLSSYPAFSPTHLPKSLSNHHPSLSPSIPNNSSTQSLDFKHNTSSISPAKPSSVKLSSSSSSPLEKDAQLPMMSLSSSSSLLRHNLGHRPSPTSSSSASLSSFPNNVAVIQNSVVHHHSRLQQQQQQQHHHHPFPNSSTSPSPSPSSSSLPSPQLPRSSSQLSLLSSPNSSSLLLSSPLPHLPPPPPPFPPPPYEGKGSLSLSSSPHGSKPAPHSQSHSRSPLAMAGVDHSMSPPLNPAPSSNILLNGQVRHSSASPGARLVPAAPSPSGKTVGGTGAAAVGYPMEQSSSGLPAIAALKQLQQRQETLFKTSPSSSSSSSSASSSSSKSPRATPTGVREAGESAMGRAGDGFLAGGQPLTIRPPSNDHVSKCVSSVENHFDG